MIDLSHLTEEEQEVIMTVLCRDAQLKKAEEERIRKLEQVLNNDTQPKSNLKYFTGEWFYEAKSRRHMDKIHGSEIILASMKQKKSPLDGSLRVERSKSPSSQGSDIVPPPKPKRMWDALQPQEINPAEKESHQVCSPRTLRHNPFNRASLLVIDLPTEDTEDMPSVEKQHPDPLKSQVRPESGHTSAGSITSDGSSVGILPVPKKRTFVPRRPGTPRGPESQGYPCPIVPAPRHNLLRGSSGSSNQSCAKPPEDVSAHVDATSPKHVVEASQTCSNSSLERKAPVLKKNRASSYITRDWETTDRQDNHTERRPVTTESVTHHNSISTHNSEGKHISSVGSANRPEQFSLTQSSTAAEPPVSYDLNFIDKSDPQANAKTKHTFKLSTQTSSPTGDEDDSITKVLDWFGRSTDSSEWLNAEDATTVINSTTDAKSEYPQSKEAAPNSDKSKGRLEIQRHEELKDTWGKTLPQDESNIENQPVKMSNLKSFWEKSNTGPKILISNSNISSSKAPTTSKDMEDTHMQSAARTHNSTDMNNCAIIHISNTDQLPPKDTCTYLNTNKNKDTTYEKASGTHIESPSLTGPEIQPETLTFSSPPFSKNKQTNSIPQLVEDRLPEEISMKIPASQLHVKDNVEFDKHVKQSGQISPEIQPHSSNGDMNRRNSVDTSPKPGMSPKRREDVSIKDKSPVLHRHCIQDVPLKDKERIKHLKSFWEQERTKTKADGKVTSGKLNKRLAKSEFDLQLIGRGSDSEEDNRHNQHFSGVQSNQKAEKSSPTFGRRQFNTLREFWDEASSESKVFTSDKTRSPKHKEPPSQEGKCNDPEISREKTSSSSPMTKSSPPPYNWSKLPLDRQTGSRLKSKSNHSNSHATLETDCHREDQRSDRDSGKDPRSPKIRKDSFSTSSSRKSSIRRATSMFSLITPDESDQLQMYVSPVHSQSRKQRVNAEKGPGPRKHSEDTETLTPRARAFVPTDYRHYLGMTDEVHSSLAPAVQDTGSESNEDHEYDFSGPVRSSTPVNTESSRRGSKTCQRLLSPSYSSSDPYQESVSSASKCWSNSRLSSNRENENDSPVKCALRRAEARPKNLAKSLEDITVASAPRTERRQERSVDQSCSSDGSPLPSPTSLLSDPEHMKKMSKSVPSFLQKELSGSVMTMYSGDFGNVDVQGTIHFSIHYVQKLREFHIFVAQCKDLAPVDPKRGRSDPYVKSYLVPDKANLGKRKTFVKKKTLNPTFNEILRYRVRIEYLRTQTLILSVWHHDTFGKNSFLGETDVDLSKWDFDHTQMNYVTLKARTCPSLAPPNCRGEMRLAIRFLPQISHSDGLAKAASASGEIHIWVKECKNLPLIRAAIDPYVKCLVLPDTRKKSRQKTRVLRGTADPVFNHTMVYDGIREADLTEACVELTVLDRDKLASNLLGGLRLGAGTGRSYGALVDWMDCVPYEVALWERMMASPNEWVEDVLPLRWLHCTKMTSK